MKVFRLSGIAIVAVFAVLIWAIATLFVNLWLSDIVESQGTKVNGATTSVADVNLGWLSGGLQLQSLALANPEDLMRNRVELDKLQFDISIQQLLKGNFHVDSLAVTNIALNQPRKKPAQRYQKDAASGGWQWPKAVAQKTQSIDADEVLKKVNIQTPQKYNAFSDKVSSIKQQWQQQASDLPDKQAVEQYQKEYDQLKSQFDDANTLEKLKLAKDLKKLTKKIKADKQKLSDFKSHIEQDIAGVRRDWNDLQGQIEKDAELAMSIVSLSPEGMRHLAASFLGEGAAGWIELALNNIQSVKKLSQSSGEPEPPPQPREGIDIPFGKQVAKPKFWIKQAEISGKLDYNNQSGRVSGTAKNLASRLVSGAPLVANLNFELPVDSMDNPAKGQLTLKVEHPVDNPNPINAQFSVSQWPISNWQAAGGTLVLSEGLTDMEMSVTGGENQISLVSKVRISNYSVQSSAESSNALIDHLIDVVSSAKQLELDIKLVQTKKDTKFDISSNLDNQFFAKIKQQLEQKAEAAKAKVGSKIESQVASQKQTIEEKLGGLADYQSLIKEKLQTLGRLQ